MLGLIIADQFASDQPGLSRLLIRIAGITMLERLVRQMSKAGVTDVVVVTPHANVALSLEIKRLSAAGWRIQSSLPNELSEKQTVPENETVLVADGCTILDDRLLSMLSTAQIEMIPVLPIGQFSMTDQLKVIRLEKNDKRYGFAGAATIRSEQVHLMLSKDGKNWLESFLPRLLHREECDLVDLSLEPTYSYDMRRNQPFLALPITAVGDNPKMKRVLLDAAQKSVLDWPAWYIHRPIEKWIIYHLCEYRITPNQLTVLNNIVAFLGMYWFATGSLIAAMASALAVGVLDGLDGKQARVKVMTSEIGRIEEVFDKIYENGWYWAIAYWLSAQGVGDNISYLLFGLLLFCNMADIVIGLVFKNQCGMQLDDFSPFERRFRVISGRRNTYIWTLIPFTIATLVLADPSWFFYGYAVITGYAIFTVTVRFWRLLSNLTE
jgi:phosphatidylglycerophosphate synthase